MKHNSKIQPAENNAVLKPAGELDALGAILLFDRRDQLAELPTDDNVATLKYLASEGMGDDTMRALASDLAHLGGQDKGSFESCAKTKHTSNGVGLRIVNK